MRQLTVSSTRSYSSTRSSQKKSAKNSQFTASDLEIFSDLSKLDVNPQETVLKKRILKKISENLPQKRKTALKTTKQTAEKDVISALMLLIHKESEVKEVVSAENLSNILEKSSNKNEEQMKITEEESLSVTSESTSVPSENCRNSFIKSSNSIFHVQTQAKKVET